MSAAISTAAARFRARARAKRRTRERGVALIMVLGAIAVLTVMLAEFQEESGAELANALAERDGVQAEYFARSAVNLSRLLIAAEPTMRQAIAPIFAFMKRSPPQLPVWEYSDRLLGAFNDEEASKDFAGTAGLDMGLAKNLGLKGGRFELSIVDEDSKLNVNAGAQNEMQHQRLAKQLMAQMARPDLNPLFEQRDSTGNFHDRMAVCSAIIDWADFDEQAYSCDVTSAAPTSSAIEDAYYQLMEKPYRRKNAPYDSLEELHMVRGMSDSLWATIVDPDPTNPKKRNMTVWGQGKINVNSANAQTLLAVVCSYAQAGTELCTDPLQMASFISAVTMAQGMAMGAPVFGSTREFIATVQGKGMLGPMLTGMGIKPVKFTSDKLLTDSITTESKVFSIYAVGVVKGYKRETRTSIHAVVDFSTAPRLNQAPGTTPSGSSSVPGTPPPVPSGSGSARQDPNAIAAAMAPATGGQILYYKIE